VLWLFGLEWRGRGTAEVVPRVPPPNALGVAVFQPTAPPGLEPASDRAAPRAPLPASPGHEVFIKFDVPPGVRMEVIGIDSEEVAAFTTPSADLDDPAAPLPAETWAAIGDHAGCAEVDAYGIVGGGQTLATVRLASRGVRPLRQSLSDFDGITARVEVPRWARVLVDVDRRADGLRLLGLGNAAVECSAWARPSISAVDTRGMATYIGPGGSAAARFTLAGGEFVALSSPVTGFIEQTFRIGLSRAGFARAEVAPGTHVVGAGAAAHVAIEARRRIDPALGRTLRPPGSFRECIGRSPAPRHFTPQSPGRGAPAGGARRRAGCRRERATNAPGPPVAQGCILWILRKW